MAVKPGARGAGPVPSWLRSCPAASRPSPRASAAPTALTPPVSAIEGLAYVADDRILRHGAARPRSSGGCLLWAGVFRRHAPSSIPRSGVSAKPRPVHQHCPGIAGQVLRAAMGPPLGGGGEATPTGRSNPHFASRNGAAPWWGRRVDEPTVVAHADDAAMGPPLGGGGESSPIARVALSWLSPQWGRPLVGAERPCPSSSAFPFVGPQWGRPLVGAERWTERATSYRLHLPQWGRPLVGAERWWQSPEPAPSIDAAMGPPLGGGGELPAGTGKTPQPGCRNGAAPWWGRRAGGVPRVPPPRSWRRNGAAPWWGRRGDERRLR